MMSAFETKGYYLRDLVEYQVRGDSRYNNFKCSLVSVNGSVAIVESNGMQFKVDKGNVVKITTKRYKSEQDRFQVTMFLLFCLVGYFFACVYGVGGMGGTWTEFFVVYGMTAFSLILVFIGPIIRGYSIFKYGRKEETL